MTLGQCHYLIIIMVMTLGQCHYHYGNDPGAMSSMRHLKSWRLWGGSFTNLFNGILTGIYIYIIVLAFNSFDSALFEVHIFPNMKFHKFIQHIYLPSYKFGTFKQRLERNTLWCGSFEEFRWISVAPVLKVPGGGFPWGPYMGPCPCPWAHAHAQC